ncbi:diguanylate cyclase (GGDEF)-like protein/putative nucleotidyltransferase with HDIG domain [Hydrogenoanaerobacterium saccharovorans]|uniref:Diguanylate cyclase (GGDEF) domain-containing protein/HDIG domain-containing protein n=1 Tax=Hydrogenoanaerobacterium saccharovorans TaxID=474960 RepID=A0A1H7YSR4_9FIRM|nr:HD domain-containing phosphohydrolase [Hydrogenoanaerobacterium saccharovorans]RPF49046.1 diguanylate cyclase (GGDEF)-like protein/putative nucleotidyltransferase with HDIG domain [Hydrogenoanaerobacterium saccharovorans]SEM48924.1 diguanylate cyclase (GGDEF) domain-containing protein/HDIG domain-containing protein [Hydrogenoanaerobacterium saccharovorans]
MGSFVQIPVIALFCYLFMGLPFLASKRNKLINAFLWMLFLLIVWTGASFCMRMQIWPSVKVWYDLSLFGLIMFPCGLLNFVYKYIGVKRSAFNMVGVVSLLLINIINMRTGFFLAPPKLKLAENGETVFVYYPTWAVSVLFIFCLLVVVQIIIVLIKTNGKNVITKQQFLPIIAGISIIFIGNFVIMLPMFKGVPYDIASGVGYAVCLYYALYQKRLFRLKLLIMRSNCYALAAVISFCLFVNFIRPMETFIRMHFPILMEYQILIIAVLFSAATHLIYYAMKGFIDRVFVKDEIVQAENLRQFSIAVSKSLKVDEILEELVQVIQNTISVRRVYVCIADNNEQNYIFARSTSSLDKNTFTFQQDNPIVQWLKTNNECMMLKDFKRTAIYKSMWEIEKQQLSEFEIECCVPLIDENSMVGIILLTGKDKNDFICDDINFLSSVKTIASIAVRNSRLYEKAVTEARTDELTGVFNRKYFYEILNEEYEKNKNESLALMILSIDDFKLYNQLYGNKEGDLALQIAAGIIKNSTGAAGYVARYSGKEFAVLLPKYDLLSAKCLAENIRKQIMDMNKKSSDYTLKALTISVGISAIPYGATTLKQLLQNVDMAVYQVKRSGKNSIMVYTAGKSFEGQKEQGSFIMQDKEEIYSEYAPTIFALTAAIDTKDHYTFNHSKNVAYYSTELTKALGLNKDTIEIIREAALLHDIGKIGIDEQILNKHGKLTPEQYEIMKRHVEDSIGIIRHLPSLDYVIPAVIGHHERYDGQGYPRRIAGEDIPLSARILCIADSFDAIISKRSYKDACSIEYALDELDKEAGKQFDPYLASLFSSLVRSGNIVPQESSTVIDRLTTEDAIVI